jgi:hypothetical protein
MCEGEKSIEPIVPIATDRAYRFWFVRTDSVNSVFREDDIIAWGTRIYYMYEVPSSLTTDITRLRLSLL